MRTTPRVIASRSLPIALLVVISACTPGVETSITTTAPTTANTVTSTTIPAPFEYRIGMTRDITTLNPWAAEDSAASRWTSYVLDRTEATLFGAVAGETAVTQILSVDPLPEPVEQSDGTWAVDLALTGTWSDGTAVTPVDVVFTFDTVRRLALQGEWQKTWFPEVVTAVTATDSGLRITFSRQPGLGVWPYGTGISPILPAHHWQDLVGAVETADALYALDGSGAPSAGPFVITGRVDGEEIRLEPNPHWGGAPAAVDSVVYAVFPDTQAVIDALVRGEIDTVIDPDGLDAAQVATTAEESGTARADLGSLRSQNNGFRFLAFNLNRPVTGNLGFRQAVDLMAVAYGASPKGSGQFEAGESIPSANLTWFDESAASRIRTTVGATLVDRLARLIEVLTTAGFSWSQPPVVTGDSITPGTGLTLSGAPVPALEVLTPAEDPIRLGYARAVVSGLVELGFGATLTEAPLDAVVERVFTPAEAGFDYDLYLAGWSLGRPEFPSHHAAFFGTRTADRGENNNTGFTSGTFDELVTAYISTRDPAQAFRSLWAMEEILATQKPYLFLYTEPITEFYRADRITFPFDSTLGGIQARGGAPELVEPAG